MAALNTGLILAVAAAVLGMIAWSVQRIIGRIDKIGDSLAALATRVTVIETKQDTTAKLTERTERVARATASKAGVRLPRELSQPLAAVPPLDES